MKKFLILVIALGLSACATKQMKASIGKPIDKVIVKYGNDYSITDLNDGRRMYEWTRTYTKHHSGWGTGTEKTKVKNKKNGVRVTTTTSSSFGSDSYTTTETCRYKFLTRFNKQRQAWIISSIKKPKFGCMAL